MMSALKNWNMDGAIWKTLKIQRIQLKIATKMWTGLPLMEDSGPILPVLRRIKNLKNASQLFKSPAFSHFPITVRCITSAQTWDQKMAQHGAPLRLTVMGL